MANWQALFSYRAANPALTAAQLSAAYNAATVVTPTPVLVSVLTKYLADNGLYATLLARAANTANATAQAAALQLLDLIRFQPLAVLDVNQTVFQAGMAAMQSVGDLTSAQVAAITALGNPSTPKALSAGEFGQLTSALDFQAVGAS